MVSRPAFVNAAPIAALLVPSPIVVPPAATVTVVPVASAASKLLPDVSEPHTCTALTIALALFLSVEFLDLSTYFKY